MNSVFIFAPSTLNMNDIGFLEGFAKKIDEDLVFYITNDKLLLEAGDTVGYCSSQTPYSLATSLDSEWLHINNTTYEFKINNLDYQEYDDNFTLILYDINAFSKCDVTTFKLQKYGEHFNNLCIALNKSHFKIVKPRFMILYIVLMFLIEAILEVFRKGKVLCQFSSVLTHFESSIKTLKWSINSIQSSDKVSIKVYNLILSKIFDFLIGFVILYVFLKYETQTLTFLNVTVENIIHGLKKLLIFLMGSPIGLKLNYAFNRTLGTFFFYHIFLWKTFMQFIKPYLYSIFYILLLPASFGLSCQAAVLEDLIKICTIHVYCIYIYAARLYGFQLNGLIGLWRLFIGRKYNPLRNRVDSHQYSHNQLFIGTLGFTILLFLLPTTLLYYVVFTVFRLLLKILNYCLIYLRIILLHLPIYSFLLWLMDSPVIAATVVVSVQSKVDEIPVILHATLKSLPLMACIRATIPHSNFDTPKIKWWQLLCLLAVNGTIDINLPEYQYIADHLEPQECRKLVAALHFHSYDLPPHVDEAEHLLSNELPCIRLLLHWNSSPGEGKGETHEVLAHRLRQLGREDLADWLGRTVFHELGKDIERSMDNPFKEFLTEKPNKTYYGPHYVQEENPTISPTEWLPFDTICYAAAVILIGIILVLVVKIFTMWICKKRRLKYKKKYDKLRYKEENEYIDSSSESEDRFDIRHQI